MKPEDEIDEEFRSEMDENRLNKRRISLSLIISD